MCWIWPPLFGPEVKVGSSAIASDPPPPPHHPNSGHLEPQSANEASKVLEQGLVQINFQSENLEQQSMDTLVIFKLYSKFAFSYSGGTKIWLATRVTVKM